MIVPIIFTSFLFCGFHLRNILDEKVFRCHVYTRLVVQEILKLYLVAVFLQLIRLKLH